jgi:hypothetical protein
MSQFLALAALIVLVAVVTPLLVAGVIASAVAVERLEASPGQQRPGEATVAYPVGPPERSEGRDGAARPSSTTATAHRAPWITA